MLLVAGSVAATELSGREGTGGLVWAVFGVAAISALVIGRWMDRVGRCPGIVLALAGLVTVVLVVVLRMRPVVSEPAVAAGTEPLRS